MSVAIRLTAATRRGALKEAVGLMRAASFDTPVLDARLIVQHALGIDWNTLYLKEDQPLTESERERLEQQLGRRAAHEPVSRIIGRRHFWTLDLEVSADTLDPRPDTESVIESVIAAIPDRATALRILDLGTGTGALLLALLSEYSNARGLGVDRSPGALATARINAASHGLQARADFAEGNWCAGLAGPFDVIVSNPPYIAHGDLAGLPPDVRDYDPAMALDGGKDGLDAYRAIMPSLGPLLSSEGLVVVEIGLGQGETIIRLGQENGLAYFGRRKDLSGIERAIAFKACRAA